MISMTLSESQCWQVYSPARNSTALQALTISYAIPICTRASFNHVTHRELAEKKQTTAAHPATEISKQGLSNLHCCVRRLRSKLPNKSGNPTHTVINPYPLERPVSLSIIS